MFSANTPLRAWLPVVIMAVSSTAHGAGLELTQHGTKETGHGFAGTAALLEDASVVAHNPAGLLRLSGTQTSLGVSAIYADLNYNVRVQREKIELPYGLDPTPVSGPGNATSKEVSIAPHLYLAHRISDDAAVGVGIYAPFASGSDFPAGWAGRYHSEETSQTTVNINPVFAFRATDTVTVGFGGFIQMYDAKLTNQIDTGYLVAEALVDRVREQEGEAAARATAEDSVARIGSQFDIENDIEIDSMAFGLSFGLLWEYSDRTRFGLNYRSRTEHVATGQATRKEVFDPEFRERLVQTVQGFANITEEDARDAVASAFDERGALGGDLESTITLPDVLTLSAFHQWTDRIAVMGSVTYTNWSVYDELRLSYVDTSARGGSDITESGDDVRRRDLVQPLEFEDSYRFGVGASYAWDDRLTLRTGASFDQSPLRNSDFRTPRGPDNDRYIVGLGASYQWWDNLSVDLAYSWIRITEGDVTAVENPAGSNHRAIGTSEGTLHNLAAQVNYRF